MTRSANLQIPAGYQLRVQGHLGDHWSAWFGDLALTHESDGTTSLSGVVPDQGELHGLLRKIRDLGVTLISVEVTDPQPRDPPSGWVGPVRRETNPSRPTRTGHNETSTADGSWFDGLTSTTCSDATTISGFVFDQSALHAWTQYVRTKGDRWRP